MLISRINIFTFSLEHFKCNVINLKIPRALFPLEKQCRNRGVHTE